MKETWLSYADDSDALNPISKTGGLVFSVFLGHNGIRSRGTGLQGSVA
jgi:hypothetical protein